ncbi:hypothetical protein SARC_15431, partial [Sphaeroforma arctica JP610]
MKGADAQITTLVDGRFFNPMTTEAVVTIYVPKIDCFFRAPPSSSFYQPTPQVEDTHG